MTDTEEINKAHDAAKKAFQIELPIPVKGVQVFAPGEDWHLNAYLGYGADWDAYAIAYKEAADKLVETFGKGSAYSDLGGYPIAFLYRQTLNSGSRN